LQVRIRLRRRPRLLLTQEKGLSPLAFGFLRPTVVVPAALLQHLAPGESCALLAHELAHHRRRDPWIIVFENVLLLCWWFNPVFWLLVKAIRKTREDCCDDFVLAMNIADSDAYCACLMRAASGIGKTRPALAALGFADVLHPLGRRFTRIMDATMTRSTGLSIAGVMAVVPLGLALLPGLRLVEAERGTTVMSYPGTEAAVPEGFEYLIPQLEPGPYRLYGRVRDESGAPAAGMKVAAFRGEAWQWGYSETTAAADGAYEFRDLPDGAYLLIAVSDRAIAQEAVAFHTVPWQKSYARQQDLSMEPLRPQPITGRVLSKKGEPVEGAQILSLAGWSSYGRGLALKIVTDKKGRYAIPQLDGPLLRPTLVAFAKGHGPGVLQGQLSTETPNEIVLEDGVRVSGTVRFKDSGRPAPGIQVLLRGTPADNDLPDITTKTDETGAFVFDRLCPFQYQLVVHNPEEGYTALEHPMLRLYDREDVEDLDVLVSEGSTVSGTVTAKETGEPFAGVRLWLPRVRPPLVIWETVTDASGRYSLRHLPAGKVAVRCELPNGVVKEYCDPGMGESPVSPTEQQVTLKHEEHVKDVDFSFERGVSVSGRVTDQAGDPIPGARLRASNCDCGRRRDRRLATSETVTEADGSYRLTGFAPSDQWDYRMTVRTEGFGGLDSEPFKVTREIQDKDFVLERAAMISGRVVDAAGRPVRFVGVALRSLEQGSDRPLPEGAITDEEGQFTLGQGAYPGKYYLETAIPRKGFGPFVMGLKRANNPPIHIKGPTDIRGLEVVVGGEDDPKDRIGAESGAAARAPDLQQPEPGTSANDLAPIPAAEDVPGTLVFHGRYRHLSRGSEQGVGSLWVKQQEDGAVSALSYLPFFRETALAVGNADHRPIRYEASREARGKYPAFEARLDFHESKAVQIRHWGDEQDDKEFPIEPGALFDLNSRPDPYAVCNILIRRLALGEGESKEFTMCDWGNGPHGQGTLPSYRVRVENKGKEAVTVRAGRFEADHLVLTQLTSADTWFKKRAGHVTDFWVLDNGVIVRILRHREPYEIELLNYAVPERLPGHLAGAEEAGETLEILSALYGARDQWVDVTEQLRLQVRGNTLDVRASNQLAGDPLDGVVKELSVHYRIGDQTHVITVAEGERLRLPEAASEKDGTGTQPVKPPSTDVPLTEQSGAVAASADVVSGARLGLSVGDAAVAPSFSAQLVDTEGKPFANVRVYLHPAIGHPDRRGQDRASMPMRNTATDGEGKFSFDAVNPGTYTVQCHWKDGGDKGNLYLDAQKFWLDVSPGATAAELTIVAPSLAAHSVGGYVHDAEGRPVAGVAVDAMGHADYSRSSTSTDSEGHYLIRGIAGDVAETIWFKGAGKAELKDVGIGTTDANVTLR